MDNKKSISKNVFWEVGNLAMLYIGKEVTIVLISH